MRTCVIIACLVMLSAAQAQELPLPSDDRESGVLPWFRLANTQKSLLFLQDPEVAAELQLIDQQISAIAEIKNNFEVARQKLLLDYRKLPLDLEPRLKYMKEFFDPIDIRARRRIITTLLPFQNRRFSEIMMQAELPTVLAQDEIVKELGYTDEQKEELAKILAPGTRRATRDNPSPNWTRPARSTVIDQCFALMTKEQQAKYESLFGEPFDVSKFVKDYSAPLYGPPPNEKRKQN